MGQVNDCARAVKTLLGTKPRSKARYESVLGEINKRQATLRRLREARADTDDGRRATGMDQSEISRLEHRCDMLLSTLERFVHASGGEMHIFLSYPVRGNHGRCTVTSCA